MQEGYSYCKVIKITIDGKRIKESWEKFPRILFYLVELCGKVLKNMIEYNQLRLFLNIRRFKMLRKKFCATLLAMSMLTSSLMPVGAAELGSQVNTQRGASATSVIDSAPPVPNVTRFWMSGFAAYWYRMETNLQKGDCMYSIDPDPCTVANRNEEYKNNNPDKFKIKSIPDKFLGCDYIVTRKSDKRGIHFVAEQKIDLYAAIDDANGKNVPSSLNKFTMTNDTVELNNNNKYYLAKRTYDEGSIIDIGKYNGKGDNVFYFVLPNKGITVSNALTHNAVVKEGKKPDKNEADKKYQYYLNDVFNLHKGKTPEGYTAENVTMSGTPTSTEEKNYKSGDNMAKDRPYTFDSQGYVGSPVDGKHDTYWESGGKPGNLTINLEADCKINKITLKLKESWGDRTQKLKIETSTDGSSYKTLVGEKEYSFKKSEKNVVDIKFNETIAQYVRITGTTNSEAPGIQLGEVEIYGPAQKVTLEHADTNQNRYAILKNGAELTKTFDKAVSGKVIFEGKVRASSNNKEMSIPIMKSEDGKTAVDLKFGSDGTIKAGNTKVMNYEKDTWYTIKMLIDINAGTYEVWVNHVREVQNVKFNEDAKNIKSMTFSNKDNELDVDNLRLYDNTEIFIVDSNFNAEETKSVPAGWNYTNAEKVSVEEVPFKEDKSLMLDGKGTSATVTFDPITGDATIEAKVKQMERGWASLPIIKDSEGKVAVKVAFYRNNLFACNGNNWEYICDQEVPNNYYPCENWYQVKIVLNTYTNRYDLYIDGARRCRNLSFATDVDNIASVTYAAEEENTIYLDNVKVFDSASLARGLYPKENVFNVRDYGAKGDGKTNDTKAIEKAIQAAEYTGGTVLLENGVFYCGQIDMLNDMSFFIDTSAELLADMNRDSYVQFKPSKGLNANNQLGRGIFRSQKTENFRILGGGMINGNGLYAWDENDPRDSRRPCVMYLTQSKDIYVENINIESSPFWTMVPFESENLTMRNIAITNNVAPNRDGIDPTNCSNFTIENCYIIAGDDCICPKSGIDMVSQNAEIRNVFMQSYCNGIKFGTDTYYDFRDYSFEDVWMKCIGLSGITIQAVDGADISDIRFKRIDMNDVDNSLAVMVGNRQRTPSGYKKQDGSIKNLVFEDMIYTNPSLSPYGLEAGEDVHESLLVGLDPTQDRNVKKGEDTHRISNVLFKNVYQEMPGGDTKKPGNPRGILSGYPEHKDVVKNIGSDNKQSKAWAYCMGWADNVKFENCTNVLLKSDVRKEYTYDNYTDKKIEPCTVTSNVEQKDYGIVFEKDGKKLNDPALSGKIGKNNEVTVLTANLLRVLEDDYELKLNRNIYENAIVKCDSNGNMKLMDRTGTVELASAKNEAFLKEDGKRQVFYVSDKDADVPKLYSVTFDLGDQKKIVRVQDGKKVSAIADPKKEGYTFKGWYLDDEKFDFDTKITKNITVKAEWEANEKEQFVVTFDVDGEKKTVKVESGQKVEAVEAPEKEGYVFTGWYLEEELFDFETIITKDITLKAGFKEDTATPEEKAKAALKAAIQAVEGYLEVDYTADSWSTFASALDTAKNVLAKEDATVDEMNAAAEALKSAQSALVKAGTSGGNTLFDEAKTTLATLVDTLKPVYEGSSQEYVATSWQTFREAYENAQIVLQTAADVSEMTGAAEKLQTAYDGLKKNEPTQEGSTSAVVETAKDLYNTGSAGYTEESWKVFANAYEEVEKAQKAGMDIHSEEWNRLIAALTTAQNALMPKVDKQIYQVTFVDVNGRVLGTTGVTEGETVSAPTTIQHPSDRAFKGWYLNDVLFDFKTIVTSNITLVAKYEDANTAAPNEQDVVAQIAAKYKISKDTLAITESYLEGIKNDKDVKGSSFSKLQAKAKKQTKTSVKLEWKEVDGADGYLVFGGKCSKGNTYKLLTTVKGKDTTTYTHTKLKKRTAYKYIVCAYVDTGFSKVTLTASKTVHTVTNGGKTTVAKKINVKPAKVSLKVGKSKSLIAKEVKSGKKLISHRKLSYESSNPTIATVSKNGKISAKKKGKCSIYVYTQNGIYKKVAVVVK